MLRKDLSLGLIALAIVLAASLGVFLLFRGGGTNEAEAGLLPPIHYKCYDIPAQTVSAPLVTLETQFGVEKDVQVLRSHFLCPPAVKTYNGSSSGDPNLPHLECYDIQSVDDPPHVVDLTDQFGAQTNVSVGPAVLLCTPAVKTVVNPPPPAPTPTPGTLPTVPHYKCYTITGPAPTGSFDLDTQFGPEHNLTAVAAQLLCAPAIKTKQVIGGQPEGDLNAPHLKCYQLPATLPAPGFTVNLLTQFTPQQTSVQVGPPRMLCQAVIKTVATPAIHYKCYQIAPQTLNISVDLQTQFGTETGVAVTRPTMLCPPALKTVGTNPPEGDLNAAHLKCYAITSHDNPGWTVTLTDQFHTAAGFSVNVGLAIEMCVPAVKEVVSPTPGPGATPRPTPGPLPTTPHYKCYEISGPAPNTAVKLESQFGIENPVTVGQAVALCAPAIKTFGGVATGDLSAPHLVCYTISPASTPGFVVNLLTQFGNEGPLDVQNSQLLCVPATKTVTNPTPTPSPSPTPSPPPLNIVHYKCYDIVQQPLGVSVDLRTQFGLDQNVQVTQSKFLCPPVVKTVGTNPPEGDLNGPHLKCYDIVSTEVPVQVVTVADQFGSQSGVHVGLPKELCVPALKAIPPDPLSGTLPTVPHYKCYEIAFAQITSGVVLRTQFSPPDETVTVGGPDRLCLPAIKTFPAGPSGVQTGDLNAPHLLCHVIIPHTSVSKVVDLLTQFGVETGVGVMANQRLCVPATKTVTFPTPTPTPVPTPTPSPTPVPTPTPNCPAPTLPPWWVPPGDVDCDGFPSNVKVGNRGSEAYIGTLPNTACGVSAWPVDNNDDKKVGLADILGYIPWYLTNVPPSPARYDINQDGKIGLADILGFIPFYLTKC